MSTFVTAALLAAALVGAAAVAPRADAAVAKGLVDAALEAEPAGSSATPAMIREIGRGLGAKWVRLSVSWSTLEPKAGQYSTTELARLDALVAGLHAAGLKVILTTGSMPDWAQDSSLWQHPPAGVAAGPQPFYVIDKDSLDDYGRLGRFLASRYKGQVQALESWNEPNLWTFFYPQRTAGDPYYAPRMYLRMLRAFHAGVRRAGGHVLVIAGDTAPVGLNDIYRTSPQRFARFLRRAGAARSFDVYSHHPYTPGGSIHPAPGQLPNDPTTTVTLGNLGTLLRLFPHKPFYLTEYGYCTQPSTAFGGFSVTEAQQGRYLKEAYRVAARYRQVKLLVWFLLRDQGPVNGPGSGVYSGLRRADGSRKPAWYAFRGL